MSIISNTINEVKNSARLQWMLVILSAICLISLSKYLVNILNIEKVLLKQQQKLYSRLLFSANNPINNEEIEKISDLYNRKVTALKAVSSISTAEAEALTDSESQTSDLISKKRINLIGTKELDTGSVRMLSVRLDISGQLHENNFVPLISHFSAQRSTTRLISLTYSPKKSNSLSYVVDFIYKEPARE